MSWGNHPIVRMMMHGYIWEAVIREWFKCWKREEKGHGSFSHKVGFSQEWEKVCDCKLFQCILCEFNKDNVSSTYQKLISI